MELHIKGDKPLKEIKQEFNGLFSHLKIEFFHHSHTEGEASPLSDELDENTIVNGIRKQGNEGELSFTEKTRVFELEDLFKNDFGLNVQVFRKSGDVWLQTTITDDWTLEEEEDTAEIYDN